MHREKKTKKQKPAQKKKKIFVKEREKLGRGRKKKEHYPIRILHGRVRVQTCSALRLSKGLDWGPAGGKKKREKNQGQHRKGIPERKPTVTKSTGKLGRNGGEKTKRTKKEKMNSILGERSKRGLSLQGHHVAGLHGKKPFVQKKKKKSKGKCHTTKGAKNQCTSLTEKSPP